MPLYMPELYEERATRQMTSVFGGLNRGARIPDGEWADMKNLTSDQYPLMATRDKRHHSDNRCCPTAVTVRHYDGGECVIWLDGVNLRFGGKRMVNLSTYGLDEDNAPKQRLLNFGAYVIVYPAMIYVNTVDMEDVGRIEDVVVWEKTRKQEDTTIHRWVMTRLVTFEGEEASRGGDDFPQIPSTESESSESEEEDTTNGMLFVYRGDKQAKGLYRYSANEGRWIKEVDYTEIRLEEDGVNNKTTPVGTDFSQELRAGDAIRFEGIKDCSIVEDGVYVVQGINYNYDASGEITSVASLRIKGQYSVLGVWSGFPMMGDVKLSRPIPTMDYICEADNRLWGCRYGEDGNGNFVNEIYCSARGDFFRWIQGAADNDDSPVTFSIGTDGPWTGCVNYGGAPTFFKERCMHRVGGYGASGFYVQDTPVRGVMSGASDSLAVVNGVLYYYADGAVMAYDGSLPVPVSEKLSPLWKYKRAVGGALYGKYYLSLYDESSTMINDDKGGKKRKPPSECALYVLDTERGLWHKEDDVEITRMATGEDDLVFVEVGEETVKSGSGVSYRRLIHTLSSIRGTANLMPDRGQDLSEAVHDWSPEETKSIGWSATSGVIGLETPDKKYLSKISIRLCLSESDGASAWVEYDSEEGWKPVGNVPQTNRMRTVTLPIIPKRCDHLRLKLEGTGTCKVYSITKTFTEAEDE